MKIFGLKINIYFVVAITILVLIITSSSGCGCLKCSVKEAFSELSDANKLFTKFDTSKYQNIPKSQETNQKVGNNNSILLWANNKFSKDCCSNNQSNYVSRGGCVCATQEQTNFLSMRGGNHKCGSCAKK